MRNRQGKTVRERLIEEIEYLKRLDNVEHQAILAYKALGAADIAVEFGLITYNEWEKCIEELFKTA
jgi:hypothetical protein